jgi:signal transduction histidine kinase
VTDGLKFGTGMEEIFIKFEIDPTLNIVTDRSRLKVVLNNIIGNALKYSSPQKEEQLISIAANFEGNNLKVLIEDNGIGIATEHQPKIFDMFYRASEKSQGSGLGLYIVRETLDKLNGKIEVSSSLGNGSRFRLEIPVELKG